GAHGPGDEAGSGGGPRSVPRGSQGEEAQRVERELAGNRVDPESRLEAPAQPDGEDVGFDLAAGRRGERRIALELGTDAECLAEVVAHAQAVAQPGAVAVPEERNGIRREDVARSAVRSEAAVERELAPERKGRDRVHAEAGAPERGRENGRIREDAARRVRKIDVLALDGEEARVFVAELEPIGRVGGVGGGKGRGDGG